MSEWDWFDAYEADALVRKHPERLRLAQLHHLAFQVRETDPDQALALIHEGQHLAQKLREPWWRLFYDHYRVHALLHFKQDYRDVLDLAIANALTTRQPVYQHFPFRLLIQDDLIAAYLGIDPPGYAEPILLALQEWTPEVPPETESGYLLIGRRIQLALELEQVDEAARLLTQAMNMADNDRGRRRARHFSVFLLADACEIAWCRKDWETLSSYAQAGEELAEQVGHRVQQATFQLWQALLLRRNGQQAEAQRLYGLATQRLSRLVMLPEPSSYDAACGYHEWAGEREAVQRIREQQLKRVAGRGMYFYECRCRLELARTRVSLGRWIEQEESDFQEVVRRLRTPKLLEQKLRELKP